MPRNVAESPQKDAVLGLFVRRVCWTLSLRGKLLCVVLAMTLSIAAAWETYPFLATNGPLHLGVLVVEGWIPTYTLSQVADEFNRGGYRKVLIVHSIDIDRYEAQRTKTTLLELGMPAASIEMVYYPAVRKDRTYHSALAVKEWLVEHGMSATPLDVATVGPHARRSWLTYQKVFDKGGAIGILALDDVAYDSQHWWRTSSGAKEVVSEVIAYVYAKLFFVWK